MEDLELSIRLNSFVLADPNKCIGCRVCEVACAVAHTEKEIKTVGNMDIPLKSRLYLVKTAEVTMPVQCHHCEDAPCVKSCLILAIKEQGNKIVIDEQNCIGCKSCIIACPFGAIELILSHNEDKMSLPELGKGDHKELQNKREVIASKCDLCNKRTKGPACVEACPQEALQYVDVEKERKNRRIEAANRMSGFTREFMVKER